MESNFTPEQKMYIEKQRLSEEDLEDNIQKIIKIVKMGKEPSERPIAVIVGGQPGAGKSGVIGNTITKLQSNCVVVDNDDYRLHHPNVNEINSVHPEIFTECTDQLSFATTPRVIASMIDERYNLVIHQTLKNEMIIKCAIADLLKAGYTVVVRALAVSELKSNLSMVGRCQDQLDYDKTCRWVPQENHDRAYKGLPDTVGKIEEQGAYHLLEVLTREENKPNHPNVIYRKRNPNLTSEQMLSLEEHGFVEPEVLELGDAKAAVVAGREADLENAMFISEEKIRNAKIRATTPEEFVRLRRIDNMVLAYTERMAAKNGQKPSQPND